MNKSKSKKNRPIVYNWDNLPVILDLFTVACIYGVNESTVKRWLYSGRIKGSKIGRKWAFSKDYIRSLPLEKIIQQ